MIQLYWKGHLDDSNRYKYALLYPAVLSVYYKSNIVDTQSENLSYSLVIHALKIGVLQFRCLAPSDFL